MSDKNEKEGTIADIADAHIKQKGMVSMKVKDGEMFIFSVTTLEFLLKQAKANPEQKAMVFIPTGGKLS